MIKSLGALIGGIFIGAAGMEIIRRKCPDALGKLSTRTREITSGVKDAFKTGYENATRAYEAAEPSA